MSDSGGYDMLRFGSKGTAAGTSVPVAVLAFIAAILIGCPCAHAEWIKDGVSICSSSGDQWYTCMTPDGVGGVFITWYENRKGVEYDYDLYAQRVDKDGNLLWDDGGVALCTLSEGQGPSDIIQDGEGGAIIVFRDERSGISQTYAQRIDADGNILWTANGVCVCPVAYPQYMAYALSDGEGNYYVAWRDDRYGYGQIYCQKLDGDGNLLWAEEGIRACPTSNWQDQHRIIPDTAGGGILVWVDERYGFMSPYIYAQRLDGDGNLLWGTTGAAICLFDYQKYTLECVPDGIGGAIVAWYDNGNGPYDIYAQRLNGSGAIQWTSRGMAICEAVGDQIYPLLVPDDSSGAIITWFDNRDGRDDIYAQRVGSDGGVKWATDGVMIREGTEETGFTYGAPKIASDSVGGAIITWVEGEDKPTSWDVFSQRVDAEGNILWADTAVSVCRATGGQYGPRIISNGENGAIISWRDLREGSDGKAYAMRVTANGETVATLLQSWTASIEDGRVLIEWSLSEIDAGVEFIVLRAEAPGGLYEELTSAEVERHGLSFSCIDGTCEAGLSYRYRVDMEVDGSRETLFETEIVALPRMELALLQNYPNPFNPLTMIQYRLPEKDRVRLEIYDTAGREIACVVDGEQKAGSHSVRWEGKDASGRSVSSGVYFYRLTAGKNTISRKMVMLK
jgi:hypothetical protein